MSSDKNTNNSKDVRWREVEKLYLPTTEEEGWFNYDAKRIYKLKEWG